MSLTISELCRICYSQAKEKGFWDKEINKIQKRNDAEMIALMHSELSEALEYLRHDNKNSDHIPEFTGVEEELADVIIRICDFAYARKIRLEEAIEAKLLYNKGRNFMHGKSF